MPSLRPTLMGTILVVLLSPPSAAAAQSGSDDVVPAPTELSGGFTCAADWEDGSKEDILLGPMGDGNLVRRETRGFMGRYTVDWMSDARFDGVHSHYKNFDEYVGPETSMPDRLVLDSDVVRIENDGGAWHGTDAYFYLPGTWVPDAEPMWEPTVVTGEGGYEGLTALVETRIIDPDCYCWSLFTAGPERCSWELRGVVLEGQMPPTPATAE